MVGSLIAGIAIGLLVGLLVAALYVLWWKARYTSSGMREGSSISVAHLAR